MRFPVRESGRRAFPKLRFLGIEVGAVSCAEAAEFGLGGGLVLAPSGPGLCDLQTDPHYREALVNADLNLPDSGLAIFLMRGLGLGKLPRTSGLGFLMALLERPELRAPGATVWAMPSSESMTRNLGFLQTAGVPVREEDCYLAPMYPARGEVCDLELLKKTRSGGVKFVFVCTGSGSQEKLGFWLRQNLPDSMAVFCIGAAIGFLSGDQVAIPRWADRMCLGWLLRCLSNPRKFVPRYMRALRLVGLAIRYRDKPPPMRGGIAEWKKRT
jgi:UDP-N-acetyl-D-mannosaminuronic acid transferase (WecB/TagA/CpsF family)